MVASLAGAGTRRSLRLSGAFGRLALACVAFILTCVPYQFATSRHLALGSEEASGALRGFSFAEVDATGAAFRWSEAEGTVRFAGVGNAPLRLRLLLHARRPSGVATVRVLANGREVASFAAGGEFAEHVIDIPRVAVGWRGDVEVTLKVDPFTAPPDTRSLGAAVATVSLEAAGWPVLPPLAVLLPLSLALLGVALTAPPRTSPTQTGAPALPRTMSSQASWLVVARVTVLATVTAVSAMLRLGRLQAGVWLWALPLLAWSAAAVTWCARAWPDAVKRVRSWARRRSRRFWVVAMVVAALLIYVPLSWTTGYWGDIEIYMAWTHQVTHHGIHSAYSPDFVAPPNTTPVLLYPFRLAGEVFRRLWSPDFPPPWEVRTNQQYLRFLLRLPALAANAAIVLVLYLYVKRKWRVSDSGEDGGARSPAGAHGVALLVAAAYLFNPAVIFESAYYGQMGAVHTLFMLLAVMLVVEKRPALGWAALTVGMLTKPQADVFAPLLLLLTWRRYRWRGLLRSALAALATALVVLAPFLYYGTLDDMWTRVSKVTSYHPILSATAHNLWWLVSLGQGKASDLGTLPVLASAGLGFVTFRVIGLGLFALAYLLVLVRPFPAAPSPNGEGSRSGAAGAPDERAGSPVPLPRRGRGWGGVYAAFAYLFLAFFILPTQIHENHLIPMFPLLLLAAVLEHGGEARLYRTLYVLFAVTTTVNMALHFPQILRVIVPQNPDIWGGSELAVPRLLDSAVQVGAFAWWTAVLLRELVQRTAPRWGGPWMR